MSGIEMLMAGLGLGILILMAGIVIGREPEQSVGDAILESLGWGTWFVVVFGGQALVVNGL